MALINLKLKAFPKIFLNIPQNLLEHSSKSLIAFSGIFLNIPQDLVGNSPESSQTLPLIKNFNLYLRSQFSTHIHGGLLDLVFDPSIPMLFILYHHPRVITLLFFSKSDHNIYTEFSFQHFSFFNPRYITYKYFCCCREIVWVCLTILLGWRLKG